MLRAAARDPLWAIISLVSAPFLLWRPVLGAAGIILLVLLVVGVGGEFALGQLGFQQGGLPFAPFYIPSPCPNPSRRKKPAPRPSGISTTGSRVQNAS